MENLKLVADTLTTSSLTAEEAAVAGGIAGGIFATLGIFLFFFYILTVIAGWKIFAKAGEKGWKSLIPIYNIYILYKIVGLKNWFWYMLIASFVYSFITGLCGYTTTSTGEMAKDMSKDVPILLLTIAYIIFALVAEIKYVSNTAKAFGKGVGFSVALFFFPNICWLILGFGPAKYDRKFVKNAILGKE